jgi:hypothetical protein
MSQWYAKKTGEELSVYVADHIYESRNELSDEKKTEKLYDTFLEYFSAEWRYL